MLKLFPISTLIWLANSFRLPDNAVLVDESTLATSYCFIIAGAGIAGLTVADRLTENPRVNVLVIEAGSFDKGEEFILVPGAYDRTKIGPYLFNISSTAQPGLGNRTFTVPIGKGVGGGSLSNAMVSFRSAKQDYDSWAALGATPLGYDQLLPYFKKSENFTGPDPDFAKRANISWQNSVHGTEGPLQVSYPNYFYPGSANWWSGALEVGFKPSPDINGGAPNGISWFTTNVDFTNRSRSDARINHYDRVIKSRPNYHILTDHTVSKILFNGSRATGVEYLPTAGGKRNLVNASKEVLLAGGAIHTPQILQLSGIGPKALLKARGVNALVDLPGVGANLQDQPNGGVFYTFKNNTSPNSDELITNATLNAQQESLYYAKRQGAWTITRGFGETVALMSLCNVTSKCQTIINEAQNEDVASLLPPSTDPTVVAGYAAQRNQTLQQYAASSVPASMIHWTTGSVVIIFLQRPLSRGSVQISSKDALDSPLVDYGAMKDPVDLNVTVATILKSRQIMQSSNMAALGPKEAAPFGESITSQSQLKSIVASTFGPTTGHLCCTAAMMPRNLGGVVGTDWKVYGTSGLRVIDISVMPMVTASTPQLTVYAMAEMVADGIKKGHYSQWE